MSMMENVIKKLRNRWQAIILLVVLILAISPTPAHSRPISSLNRASIALGSGKLKEALGELDNVLAIEPALAELHLLASDVTYYLGEVDQSAEHVEAAEGALQDGQVGFCRQARIEIGLTLQEPPDPNWKRSIQECPFVYKAAAQELLELFQSNPQKDLIPYLEQLYLSDRGGLQIEHAYAQLLSVYDPVLAVDRLRRLTDLHPVGAELERDLMRAIVEAKQEASPAYTYAQIGQVFARYQKWSLAKLAFQNALVEEPDFPDAQAYLGMTMEQTGQDGYALISSAISTQPQDPRAYVFLAIHHLNRNEITAAHQALDQAARLDPENPAIAAQLGAVYAEIGDFSAATQAYLVATELAPDDGQFWRLLARFSLDHDIDLPNLGLPAARNAVSVEPGNSSAYELLGTIQLELEQYNLALRSFRTALTLDALSARSQYLYGILMLTSGQRDAAEAAFLAAATLDESGRYNDRATLPPE
jgi:cytochrome c-type biogenesis protein CcmH/NrfG